MVKKFISLLLISVCLGDTLILKDKTEYNGILMKFVNDEIMFRAWPSAKLSINISDVQELKLSDGTRVIENGIVVATNEKHIKNISYDRYLTIKPKHKKKHSYNVVSIARGQHPKIIADNIAANLNIKIFQKQETINLPILIQPS